MDRREFSAKTVSEAITKACMALEITSDHLDYEVISEGSSGFLGIGAKPAIIIARAKQTEENTKTEGFRSGQESAEKKSINQQEESFPVEERTSDFLNKIFDAMKMEVTVKTQFYEAEKELSLNLEGEDMGILIGKRGQTLDSLQYLVSLVANKGSEKYIRVKLDTENYRERRKETLEILAKNIAYKVKRTKHSVALEPMNPYERRIIHAALQNDRYVTTRSEGEDPFRHVVIALKKEAFSGERKGRYEGNRNGHYEQRFGGYKGGSRRNNYSESAASKEADSEDTELSQ